MSVILYGYRILNKENISLVKDIADRYTWNNKKDNHQFLLLPTATQNAFLKGQYIPLPGSISKQRHILCRGEKKTPYFSPNPTPKPTVIENAFFKKLFS